MAYVLTGSEEVPCPPPTVDQSDSSESDPGYKSAEGTCKALGDK